MKDCTYFQKMLSDKLDGNLAEIEIAELNNHLDGCAECRDFEAGILQYSSDMKSLPEVNLMIDSVSKVTNTNLITKLWNLKISIPLPAAAAVIILLGGFFIYQDLNMPHEIPQSLHQPAEEKVESIMLVRMEPQSAYPVEINNSTQEEIQ